ncbi:hypothetical protein RCO28_34600 [Streptomyces sp. LHD-70]|uniref:hypothetical protein n=1 Tax=Streptomyces sp. LHD-70 TaxID=3072140 RepID=UPI00280EF4DB|nr:hypothetical protein [Streptomyces sp. LHD-70]MDQ8707564.1 hypothetical protein [Streptomyces sp. LHD-70]
MNPTPMPEALRLAVHQLVSEASLNCQEVLRYTEPDVADRWRRMTLYRTTDAADTMDMAALLIAAYCEREGMPKETLDTYLQVNQQHIRAAGPQESDRHEAAGLCGDPAPESGDPEARLQFSWGRVFAKRTGTPDEEPQRLLTQACLHGLRARLCDDVDSLDRHLPPHIAAMARKVADALEMPQPAVT